MKDIHYVESEQEIDMNAEAEGAMPNFTPVTKQNAEKGDTHPNGTKGIVVGSLATPEAMKLEDDPKIPANIMAKLRKVKYMYFVRWENSPVGSNPVCCVDYKVKEA